LHQKWTDEPAKSDRFSIFIRVFLKITHDILHYVQKYDVFGIMPERSGFIPHSFVVASAEKRQGVGHLPYPCLSLTAAVH
jgi:hypothetical protein